jgi:hypothetical protein
VRCAWRVCVRGVACVCPSLVAPAGGVVPFTTPRSLPSNHANLYHSSPLLCIHVCVCTGMCASVRRVARLRQAAQKLARTVVVQACARAWLARRVAQGLRTQRHRLNCATRIQSLVSMQEGEGEGAGWVNARALHYLSTHTIPCSPRTTMSPMGPCTPPTPSSLHRCRFEEFEHVSASQCVRRSRLGNLQRVPSSGCSVGTLPGHALGSSE